MRSIIQDMCAKAGSIDHIGPGIITVYYRVIYQRINSGARWSIYSGGMWSGYPAYADVEFEGLFNTSKNRAV